MNTLVLDKTDPDIASLIADWQDGQSYVLTNVQMEQTSSDETKAVFHVTTIEVEEQPEATEPALTADTGEEEAAAEAKAVPAMKPKAPAYAAA